MSDQASYDRNKSAIKQKDTPLNKGPAQVLAFRTNRPPLHDRLIMLILEPASDHRRYWN